MMNMIGFLCLWATIGAQSSGDIQTEMMNAFRQTTLLGLGGTLSFDKEMWYPPRADSSTLEDQIGRSSQRWEITTDGQARLWAKVTFLTDSASPTSITVGDTGSEFWMILGHEVFVCDKESTRGSNVGTIAAIHQLVEQSWTELSNVLAYGGSGRADVPRELISVDVDATQAGAVMKISGRMQKVSFDRVGSFLLPASITVNEGHTRWRWLLKGYRETAGRWLPRVVEHVGESSGRTTNHSIYSEVVFTPHPESTMGTIDYRFRVPRRSDPDCGHLAMIISESAAGRVSESVLQD